MDRLEQLRSFVAVAQEESFTCAALRLGQSTRLVSKYVAHLETRLGVQLFNRTTRRVALTEAGATLLLRARPLLDQFDDMEAELQASQRALSGTIRLTAPTGFGSGVLPDALATFQTLHPEVSIDLRLGDAVLSLVDEGLDLAIRIGTLKDSTLIARKLADMPQVICAAPDYLARSGKPQVPDDLQGHNCLIGSAPGTPTVWSFRHDGETLRQTVSGRFRANAPAAAARMAVAGLGVANCPFYTVEADLREGRLVRLLSGFDTGDSAVFAVYPSSRHPTARLGALVDHLHAALRNRFHD